MPKIKKAIDLEGEVFYPITITDGVYDIANSQRLSTTLAGKSDKSTTYTKTEVDSAIEDCAYVGDNYGSAVISDPPITPQSIGFGIGTCSTAATTAAKEVSIQNFVLTKNGIISVFFTSAIDSQNSTLNVNNTGAKNIKINSSQLNPGVVRARTILVLQYDGTAWNIISMSEEEKSMPGSDLWVDLGLPSGVKWAKTNIDLSQQNGFAASPFQYECSFFSWGNTDEHNPTATNSFSPWDWGNANNVEPYVSSEGAKLTSNISLSNDAARVNLGAPWRMPTTEEYKELFDNCDFVGADGETVIDSATTNKLVTVSTDAGNIIGIYLKSKNNNKTLFFSCTGYGYNASWNHRGGNGNYSCSTVISSTSARCMSFNEVNTSQQGSISRFFGLACRAVQ